jgi:hypothetical protein
MVGKGPCPHELVVGLMGTTPTCCQTRCCCRLEHTGNPGLVLRLTTRLIFDAFFGMVLQARQAGPVNDWRGLSYKGAILKLVHL